MDVGTPNTWPAYSGLATKRSDQPPRKKDGDDICYRCIRPILDTERKNHGPDHSGRGSILRYGVYLDTPRQLIRAYFT